MTIDAKNLLNFYDGLYNEDIQADDVKKSLAEDLKSYAQNLDVDPKAIKAGYKLYKKYRAGKTTIKDLDDYTSVENIVTEYFVNESEDMN